MKRNVGDDLPNQTGTKCNIIYLPLALHPRIYSGCERFSRPKILCSYFIFISSPNDDDNGIDRHLDSDPA